MDNWAIVQVLALNVLSQRAAQGLKEEAWYWVLIFLFSFPPFSFFFFYLMLNLRQTASLKMKWPALKCASLLRSHLTLPDCHFRGIARTQMGASEETTLPFCKESFKELCFDFFIYFFFFKKKGSRALLSLMKTIFMACACSHFSTQFG